MSEMPERDDLRDLLAESGFERDEQLYAVLRRLRSEGTATRPEPGPRIAPALSRAPRRRRPSRGMVIALVVGAGVMAGGAAAASPGSPIAEPAATLITGLLGLPAPGADQPPAELEPQTSGPGEGTPGATPTATPTPAATHPAPQEHPAPAPASSHAPGTPGTPPAQPSPDPHATPGRRH